MYCAEQMDFFLFFFLKKELNNIRTYFLMSPPTVPSPLALLHAYQPLKQKNPFFLIELCQGHL